MKKIPIKDRVKEAATKYFEAKSKEEPRGWPPAYNPWGYFILLWALFLDFLDVITHMMILLMGIGLVFSLAINIVGLITIGSLGFYFTHRVAVTKRLLIVLRRMGLFATLEFISDVILPFVGVIVVGWSAYVIYEMIKNPMPQEAEAS
ncbi:MAG: hypothetical protein R3251_02925 [Candidatus Spechtbacterales bacterium]|nr:hypothetical protein [Candidatus Spechtbacterales bacterium]